MYDGLGGAERVSRLSVERRVDRLVVVRIDRLMARVGRLGVVRVACLGVTGIGQSSCGIRILGKCSVLSREHLQAVTSVTFSPDGQTLASGSKDRTIKIWRSSP